MTMIEEFKQFLRESTPWPGITEYRNSIGLTTDWKDFEEAEPRLSEQTKSNLLKVHIQNTGTK
tara:strand:+ start:864 stop:1052 length:189 start_codon:yes stop_codon:yes gene_type:complete